MARENEWFEKPEDILESDEVARIVNQTLEGLPEKTANIFRMSRFEGMKYMEIADELNISVKTVEANISKALVLFRENLKNYIKG